MPEWLSVVAKRTLSQALLRYAALDRNEKNSAINAGTEKLISLTSVKGRIRKAVIYKNHGREDNHSALSTRIPTINSM